MFAYMFNTLPHFLAYFASALLLFAGYLFAYVTLTPHREFALIRDGNTAAAVQLVGSALGFGIPLAVVIGHSVNIPDVFAWGLVVLVVQAATFWVIRMMFKDISRRLTDNCVSSGVFVGGIALTVGIIQAGCMVP